MEGLRSGVRSELPENVYNVRIFINVHFLGETVCNPEKFKNYKGEVCESGRSIRGAQNSVWAGHPRSPKSQLESASQRPTLRGARGPGRAGPRGGTALFGASQSAPHPSTAAAQRFLQGGREGNRWGPNAARARKRASCSRSSRGPSPTPSGYWPARTPGDARGEGEEASPSVWAGQGRKDTAWAWGRGRGGKRKAPELAPTSTASGAASVQNRPGQSCPTRASGDPPTRGAAGVPGSYGPTPVGSRGAATSRRVCPGARRAGEEPRGPAPRPRRAPGPRAAGPLPSPLPGPAAPAPHLPSQLRRTPQASHRAPTGRAPPRRL